jgi:hypothetical protein
MQVAAAVLHKKAERQELPLLVEVETLEHQEV